MYVSETGATDRQKDWDFVSEAPWRLQEAGSLVTCTRHAPGCAHTWFFQAKLSWCFTRSGDGNLMSAHLVSAELSPYLSWFQSEMILQPQTLGLYANTQHSHRGAGHLYKPFCSTQRQLPKSPMNFLSNRQGMLIEMCIGLSHSIRPLVLGHNPS